MIKFSNSRFINHSLLRQVSMPNLASAVPAPQTKPVTPSPKPLPPAKNPEPVPLRPPDPLRQPACPPRRKDGDGDPKTC